jgi:hypothetical protein
VSVARLRARSQSCASAHSRNSTSTIDPQVRNLSFGPDPFHVSRVACFVIRELPADKRLKKGGPQAVSLKVSEKGGVSVYGLGRFPVTLYKEQWATLLDMADEIRRFMKEENDSKLHEGRVNKGVPGAMAPGRHARRLRCGRRRISRCSRQPARRRRCIRCMPS